MSNKNPDVTWPTLPAGFITDMHCIRCGNKTSTLSLFTEELGADADDPGEEMDYWLCAACHAEAWRVVEAAGYQRKRLVAKKRRAKR